MKHKISTKLSRIFILLTGACLIPASYTYADILHLDDVITTFSHCMGNDCVNGESFGFDTLRLKENNLRIKADDTSTSASFPNNDWQLTFNDTVNGGANKFSIDDITGGRTPFTIIAGAPSHSLFVSSAGRLGLGTSTPVVQAHMVDGNTPTLRLEQDGSSGFTAQTWDVAGNEANFFVRDATNGSTLPLRIYPGAPSNSFTIEGTTGDIGVGTTSPLTPVHVRQTDGSAKVLVEEASGTMEKRVLMELQNNGAAGMLFTNTNSGVSWELNPNGSDNFIINSKFLGPGAELIINKDSGNMNVKGEIKALAFNVASSRETKEEFAPVDPMDILDSVASLDISEWQYKQDKEKMRHIGPMAEDFEQAFNLGTDGKTIGVTDVNGIALASIQALHQKLKTQNESLTKQNELLNQRLEKLEQLLLN